MTEPRPLCGAQFSSGKTCREHFDLCLALEYEHPSAFRAVYFLTVVCYMFQHNAYGRGTWLDSGRRDWSITRGHYLAEFESIAWTCTIADSGPGCRQSRRIRSPWWGGSSPAPRRNEPRREAGREAKIMFSFAFFPALR